MKTELVPLPREPNPQLSLPTPPKQEPEQLLSFYTEVAATIPDTLECIWHNSCSFTTSFLFKV